MNKFLLKSTISVLSLSILLINIHTYPARGATGRGGSSSSIEGKSNDESKAYSTPSDVSCEPGSRFGFINDCADNDSSSTSSAECIQALRTEEYRAMLSSDGNQLRNYKNLTAAEREVLAKRIARITNADFFKRPIADQEQYLRDHLYGHFRHYKAIIKKDGTVVLVATGAVVAGPYIAPVIAPVILPYVAPVIAAAVPAYGLYRLIKWWRNPHNSIDQDLKKRQQLAIEPNEFGCVYITRFERNLNGQLMEVTYLAAPGTTDLLLNGLVVQAKFVEDPCLALQSDRSIPQTIYNTPINPPKTENVQKNDNANQANETGKSKDTDLQPKDSAKNPEQQSTLEPAPAEIVAKSESSFSQDGDMMPDFCESSAQDSSSDQSLVQGSTGIKSDIALLMEQSIEKQKSVEKLHSEQIDLESPSKLEQPKGCGGTIEQTVKPTIGCGDTAPKVDPTVGCGNKELIVEPVKGCGDIEPLKLPTIFTEGNDTKNSEKPDQAKPEWIPYKKHISPASEPWNNVVRSTVHGSAKYKPEVNIEQLELKAWKKGAPVKSEGNVSLKVFESDKTIGAYEGKETNYVLVKVSQNVLHGHPISKARFQELLKR